MAVILLICMILIVIYPYTLYPAVLKLIAKYTGNIYPSGNDECVQSVSIIIAAYNEEKAIFNKIINTLSLEYPYDRLEVLVGSDGSEDNTDNILSLFKNDARVKAYSFNRNGKSAVLRKLITMAKGEILVFTDATSVVSEKALTALVRHFTDRKVGAVAGNIRFENEGLFEKYERLIKRLESNVGTVIGASGALYAVRKEIADDFEAPAASDDFYISMLPFKKNKKVVFEEDAIVYENEVLNMKQQFRKYLRLGAGGFQAVIRLKRLLLPDYGLTAFAFWSHRVIRWITPFIIAFLCLLCISMSLASGFFMILAVILAVLLILSSLFYHSSVFVKIAGRLGIIFRYFIINYALMAGSIGYLFGRRYARWNPVR